MVAALVERTGHGYQELMAMPYEEVLQMNVDILPQAEAEQEAIDREMNAPR